MLSSERKAWCGTGFVDDGRLTASSHFIPNHLPPGTPLRLTPFGAYALEPGKPNTLAVFEVADRYHKLRKAGDTGRLFPRGSFILRPDPKTALEPGGSVFVGQRLAAKPIQPTAEQWSQVPATLRSAARAQGFRPPEPAALPEGVVLVAGVDSRPTAQLPAGTVVDRLGPATDPCACEGTLECALANKVTLDYAGYALCVPETWFWRHYLADDWLSVNETMEDLWRGVNVHGTSVSSEVTDNLLGCWMIDTDNDSHGRTYSMFFNDGNAPRKFLHYALDLVRRFSEEIKDEWSGVTTCSGLRGYIEDVLDGEKGSTLTEGVGPCTVKFLAVSESTWLPAESDTRSCGDAPASTTLCAETSGFGDAFDDWGMALAIYGYETSDSAAWRPVYQVMVETVGNPIPMPSASAFGMGDVEAGSVLLPANRLAFRGYQFDFSMFWARTALQFAYERSDWQAWYGAWVYARAALFYQLEAGRVLIHELGHLHMGQGGHCLANDKKLATACCFDIAAEHWKCRVGAALGVPYGTSFIDCGSDPYFATPEQPCGGEDQSLGEIGQSYAMICDQIRECHAESAAFSAGPCS